MDLVEFLRARLDEDERRAPEVHLEDCALHNWLRFDVPSTCDCGQPARVLAEVDAKRQIVDLHAPVPVNFGDETACTECARGPINGWCSTLRLLALPYAGHADYDERWRV